METKKFTAVFVFGELAVHSYEFGDWENLIADLDYCDGRIVRKEFDTEAELRAYQQGLEDMDGWSTCCCMADDDIAEHADEIEEYL